MVYCVFFATWETTSVVRLVPLPSCDFFFAYRMRSKVKILSSLALNFTLQTCNEHGELAVAQPKHQLQG